MLAYPSLNSSYEKATEKVAKSSFKTEQYDGVKKPDDFVIDI
jgi:hypothetical protein